MVIVLSPSQAIKRPGLLAVISSPDEPTGHLSHIVSVEGIDITKITLYLIQHNLHLGIQPGGTARRHQEEQG